MPKYPFEVRATRPETNRYLYDGVDTYITTIQAEDAADAQRQLDEFKLIAVPASNKDTPLC